MSHEAWWGLIVAAMSRDEWIDAQHLMALWKKYNPAGPSTEER